MPVLPVALGARSIAIPIVTNAAILEAAVAVTYLIGLAAKAIWGISVS